MLVTELQRRQNNIRLTPKYSQTDFLHSLSLFVAG